MTPAFAAIVAALSFVVVLWPAAAPAAPPAPDVFLDAPRAAASYDAVSRDRSLEAPARRAAAREAAMLYGRLGDEQRMAAARAIFVRLDPPAEQRAEVDWILAAVSLAAWDERRPDEGDNRAARVKAIAAMDAYHATHKADPAAAVYVVRSAYHSARLRRAGVDPRADEPCRSTVAAFERLRAAGRAPGSTEADMAAECAYTLLDEKIKTELDLASGRPRYAGAVDRVLAGYEADLKKAEGWHRKLQEVVERYPSAVWSPVVRARQGSIYDAVRTALYDARPPALRYVTPQEERLLGTFDLPLELVDELRERIRKRRDDFHAERAHKLAVADEVMVRRYAEAVILARAWKARSPAVDAAVRRLAFFTIVLGDAEVRRYTQGIADPSTKQPFAYTDGLFLRTRPGLVAATNDDLLAAPLPATP